ncbi:MAG: hypothetical protein ABSH11_14520 [Verrucomicrobiota bacterium]|jgi:uncharacterized integral membrane protein
MENKPLSEHKWKLKFTTIIPVILISLLLLTFIAGIGTAFYLYRTGQKITWSDGIIVFCGGAIIAVFCGIMVARYLRRMLSVRRVLLFEDDRIGVVTWRGKLFVAKLPDNIEHMLIIGTDLTVTLKIENRHFIVSSEEFSDKDGINEYLRRFLQRYQTQAE